MTRKIITKTVVILSLISMFADVASEMLYPIIPVYLKGIGFSVALIGLLEGIAEFVVGLSKGYFGQQSDLRGQRVPFIRLGYFFSNVAKPLMAVSVYPLYIFGVRTTDRLGKGLRTAARDALLSQEATTETKAKVFGFHRAMDTLGAVIGPLLSLVLLYYFHSSFTQIFLIAFIPGCVSIALTFFIKEKKSAPPTEKQAKANFFSFFKYWRIAPPQYRYVVVGMLMFALFNSSDMFLILKAKEISQSDVSPILAYVVYNLVYALMSYPLGMLADKFSNRKVLTFGLMIFSLVYFGFAFANNMQLLYFLFLIYGLYAAATDGVSKAWLTNIVGKNNVATSIGFYTSCQSIAGLLASIIAGGLWSVFGSRVCFLASAIATLLVVVYFFVRKKDNDCSIAI